MFRKINVFGFNKSTTNTITFEDYQERIILSSENRNGFVHKGIERVCYNLKNKSFFEVNFSIYNTIKKETLFFIKIDKENIVNKDTIIRILNEYFNNMENDGKNYFFILGPFLKIGSINCDWLKKFSKF